MGREFCQFKEVEVLWCVEVVVREAYMVDATAATRFGRVLHSLKTIIFLKFQIINHPKFYPLHRRQLCIVNCMDSIDILSLVPFMIQRA